ncbi:GAF domain-containing protein [Aliigemmobacter aestuarii]|uniref:GAF domain-containing protein n=1 Tax=Aliigemmobacter aestuarii TaxID=1445661 RepID=A0A4V3V0F4_9RHOB|nr:GAF domain-containing protein [Gemmobacter aestuarii]THD83732.1 GAF domain-containing protein [Gemmobacter aestuarii]
MTDPAIVFADLHAAMGGRLFTITVQDDAAGVVRRAWSSAPEAYPVSGTKPLQHDRWSLQVLVQGESFVANTTAEFADVFPDHELINSLGCHSAMNIPVFDGDRVLGTINILDAEGFFTEERVLAFETLALGAHDRLVAAMRAVDLSVG